MIQVYTGSGKGKTTAAMGLALRALGQGKSVFLIQFLKKNNTGEIKAAKRFKNFQALQCGRKVWLKKGAHTPEDERCAKIGFSAAEFALKNKKFDLVILDELNVALHFRLLQGSAVKKMLRLARKNTEVIITGRHAPKEIVRAADLVSEIREVKHYYRRGIGPRKGIEF